MNYKFAIPVKDEVVSDDFRKAKEFCFIDVTDRQIQSKKILASPIHDPGIIPAWLAENRVTHVFAVDIGKLAIEILNDYKIEVIWGVPNEKPEYLVNGYLDSQLASGQ